jgi:hypothetical protein
LELLRAHSGATMNEQERVQAIALFLLTALTAMLMAVV